MLRHSFLSQANKFVIALQQSVFSTPFSFILHIILRRYVFMMKKIVQNVLAPFLIFSAGLVLIGCEQANLPTETETHATESEQTVEKSSAATATEAQTELKSGNMFYLVRDVADMQLKAGDYVEQLKQTQSDLQTAINDKDQQLLQTSAQALQQQLTAFNRTLSSLDLKSQEIDAIRQNILTANQQVLASPFLNGSVNFAQVDFNKIQQQMGSIQNEMLKLAAMMIPKSENSDQES